MQAREDLRKAVGWAPKRRFELQWGGAGDSGGGVDTEKEEKEKNETIDMADRDSGGGGGSSKLYVEGVEELVRLMVRLFAACI